mgnify:CR=1 FL=1
MGLDWEHPELVQSGRIPAHLEAVRELQERGLVRAIGVSNFPKEQLAEIIEATGAAPAIHQIELHPYFPQASALAFSSAIWPAISTPVGPFTFTVARTRQPGSLVSGVMSSVTFERASG